MAVFRIRAPDGRTIRIEAADEATAIRGAQEWAAANPSGYADALSAASQASQSLFAGGGGPVQRPAGEPRRSTNVILDGEEYGRPWQSPLPGIAGDIHEGGAAASAGFLDLITSGFGDEIAAGVQAIPGAARDAIEGRGFDVGRAYNRAVENNREIGNYLQERNPIANLGGSVVGAVFSPLNKIMPGVGPTAGLLPRIASGAVSGAAQGALYGAGSGETNEDRINRAVQYGTGGAAVGAALAPAAAAFGRVVNSGRQNAVTNAAIRNAPPAADLRAQASQMFQQVDQAGVTINPQSFGSMVAGLVQNAQRMRMNPTLDPKATGAYQELVAMAQEALSGAPISMGTLHNMRQIAQRAAVSSEGRDAMFANQIVDALDNFITQPGAAVGPGGQAAGNTLLNAISTWGRARRVGMVEEAIYRAGNTASGLENGLRVEFRRLLQNPQTRNQFNAAERQAIEQLANGTGLTNLVRLLGKFGFGGGSASNMLGGTIGFGAGSLFGGPLAGIAAAILGTAARRGSEALASRAADRVSRIVATPNVPVVSPVAIPAPPGVPLLTADQMNRNRP